MSKYYSITIRLISTMTLAAFILTQAGVDYCLAMPKAPGNLRQQTVESETSGNAVGTIGNALGVSAEAAAIGRGTKFPTAGEGGKRTEEKAIAFIKEYYGGVGSSDSEDWLNSQYGAETREIMAAITRAELPPWGALIEKAGYEPLKRKRPISQRERVLHQIAKILGFGRPYRGQDVIDYRKAHNIPWVLTGVWRSEQETEDRKKTVLVYAFPPQKNSAFITIEDGNRRIQVLEGGEVQLEEMGYRPVKTIGEAEDIAKAFAERSRQAIRQIRAAQTASRRAARERAKAAAAAAGEATASAAGFWVPENMEELRKVLHPQEAELSKPAKAVVELIRKFSLSAQSYYEQTIPGAEGVFSDEQIDEIRTWIETDILTWEDVAMIYSLFTCRLEFDMVPEDRPYREAYLAKHFAQKWAMSCLDV